MFIILNVYSLEYNFKYIYFRIYIYSLGYIVNDGLFFSYVDGYIKYNS